MVQLVRRGLNTIVITGESAMTLNIMTNTLIGIIEECHRSPITGESLMKCIGAKKTHLPIVMAGLAAKRSGHLGT